MAKGKLRLNNLGALLAEKRKAGQFLRTEVRQKGGSSNHVKGCQCLPFSGCNLSFLNYTLCVFLQVVCFCQEDRQPQTGEGPQPPVHPNIPARM